jgi:hypothetical protein
VPRGVSIFNVNREALKMWASAVDFELSGIPTQSYSSSDEDLGFARTGIEASAGFSGKRARPATASTPEDYRNNYRWLAVISIWGFAEVLSACSAVPKTV